jgi:hypothetical protein
MAWVPESGTMGKSPVWEMLFPPAEPYRKIARFEQSRTSMSAPAFASVNRRTISENGPPGILRNTIAARSCPNFLERRIEPFLATALHSRDPGDDSQERDGIPSQLPGGVAAGLAPIDLAP